MKDAALDPKVDEANREAVLCDFVRFSLLAAMGKTLKHPAKRQEDFSLGFEHGHEIAVFN